MIIERSEIETVRIGSWAIESERGRGRGRLLHLCWVGEDEPLYAEGTRRVLQVIHRHGHCHAYVTNDRCNECGVEMPNHIKAALLLIR